MTLGYVIARKITAPVAPRDLPLTVRRSTPRTVTFDATDETTRPGSWGVFLGGGAHLQVQGVPVISNGQSTWSLGPRCTSPVAGAPASWTGIVHHNPAAAGLNATDHIVPTGTGATPAWFIGADPGATQPVWSIHIHGLHSSRAGVLRGVLAASDAGIPSVVPAYRNTTEGPRVGSGRSRLGWTEAEDISAVLEHLSVTGRERFVLFGWSMGAQIALRLAASVRWGQRIESVVLESPVLDWRSTLAANVAHAGAPGWAGPLAHSWLERRSKARLLGLDGPIPLRAMDWISRAAAVTRPVLIHHGTSDWSSPIADSRAFVAAASSATLLETDAGHTTSWNVDPGRWHQATTRFLRNPEHWQRDGFE